MSNKASRRRARKDDIITMAEIAAGLLDVSEDVYQTHLRRVRGHISKLDQLHAAVRNLVDYDDSYSARIAKVRTRLYDFAESGARVLEDPIVVKLDGITHGWYSNVPILGHMIEDRKLKRELGSATRRTLGKRGRTIPLADFEDAVDNDARNLVVGSWVREQRNVIRPLEILLGQLDDLNERGGGESANRYMKKFVYLFSTAPAVRWLDEAGRMMHSMSNPRSKTLMGINKDQINIYANLGSSGAIGLYDLVDSDNSILPRNRVRLVVDFTWSAIRADDYVQKLRQHDIPIGVATELVGALPVGQRRYGLNLLLQKPEYVDLYRRIGVDPSVYMSFIRDYADISISNTPNTVFDIVNKISQESSTAAVNAIINPDLVTRYSPEEIVEMYQQAKRIGKKQWFDLMYAEDDPIHDSVIAANRKLKEIGMAYRLKQVSTAQMGDFCNDVLQLPLPLLRSLLGNDSVFQGYVSRIGPRTLDELKRIALDGGNTYANLVGKFAPHENQSEGIVRRLFDLSRSEEQQAYEKITGGYKSIVIFGNFKPVQQQEIRQRVREYNVGELIFVNPSERHPKYGEAVVLVGARSPHSDLARAENYYRGKTDVYKYAGNQVGAKAIADIIRNVQISKAA
ncbi:MAG: hypothetical protein HYW22_02810 [Candidatus Aenigmarchaeota archaeon]|nr:hypothetical protein [Candidatus Aenigmarchaeota archaeon]